MPDLIELMGERIRHARDAAGISQATLASRLGVDVKTISRWENGRHQATRRNAIRLADALGVSVEALGGELPAPYGTGASSQEIHAVDAKFSDMVADIAGRLERIEEILSHLLLGADAAKGPDQALQRVRDWAAARAAADGPGRERSS